MVDTTITIPTVGTPNQGNIDVAQVTNPTLVSTVLRENVVLADPVNFTGQAQATNARGIMSDTSMYDMFQQLLIELRLNSQLLNDGLNLGYDLENIRSDPTNAQLIQQ